MNKICFGCGVKIQSDDKNSLGFVPLEKLEDSQYCQRCFRMMHYGDNKKSVEPKSSKEIISCVNKRAKYVVFLVDFINIFDDVMELFKSIRVPKMLVISKSDIIPKNVSFSQIKNYLRVTYNIREDIVFTSNKTNLNTFVKKLYGLDEVYFLGLTNAGKSTLINSLLDRNKCDQKRLTVSYKENTTQDFLRINIGDMTIVDSPGFVFSNYELDKKTNIDSVIKPITYQNKMYRVYSLGNAFQFGVDGSTSLTFYFSKQIDIERFYNKRVDGMTFNVEDNTDIVICGLGFIKFTKKAKVTIPSEIMRYVNVRPSIVGGKYEQD